MNARTIHTAIVIGRLMSPHCQTRSAFDKNLKAAPSSMNPKMIFTEFIQDPLLGKACSPLGNIANSMNGLAKAAEKANMPRIG